MDIDKLYALRGYIFQYATGVLWLLAFLVFAGTPDYASFFKTVHGASVPETLVTSFAIAIGIVIPYTIATALRPLSRFLHDYFLRVDRAFRTKYRSRLGKLFKVKKPYQYHSRKPDLRDGARAIVKGRLHVREADEDELLAFVNVTNPRVAALLELQRDEDWFHLTAVLPTALLAVACAYKIQLGLPCGVILGVLVLAVGVSQAEKEMVIWRDRVDAAVMLVASNETPSATTSPEGA